MVSMVSLALGDWSAIINGCGRLWEFSRLIEDMLDIVDIVDIVEEVDAMLDVERLRE